MASSSSLQHEDLLIQLRAKLNEEKIKLWEPPYVDSSVEFSSSLMELARKYAEELQLPHDTIVNALRELQLHSLERNAANTEFKETGVATFRVKVTLPDKKSCVLRVQKKLNTAGGELIAAIAKEIEIAEDRIKLIFNGKVIKPTPTLEEQGLKNGGQLMALIMAEAPETLKKEDNMYMEMKTTRDDAMLLSEYVDDLADDDEYMKLEDQSGNTVELPPAEKKSLLVGLALHERGRAALKNNEHALALVLLLEADRQLSECRSSILSTVDNWALLQLDISWCYLWLQALGSCGDAAERLRRAEDAFRASYGAGHTRLVALKGTAANERVVLMRLYLLQGIVAYHQNKRAEAKLLLDKAEDELNVLRVDETAVTALTELGWSRAAARAGLRAAGGSLDAAHHYLHKRQLDRERARETHRLERQRRVLGVCDDGTPVNPKLVEGLQGMGFSRRLAAAALRRANNHAADAARLIQDQPHLLAESDWSSEETETSSGESVTEPDNKLVAELEAMGYASEDARCALRAAGNRLQDAVEILVAAGGHVTDEPSTNPSTSKDTAERKAKRMKKHKSKSKRREREQAWRRLSAAIRGDEDDHLHSELRDEENFLAQYKSLL